MKGQIATEFIITFSFFILIVVTLILASQSKIEEYNEIQNREDNLLKCKMIGDFIASNLSYKQNELNVSAIYNYLNKTNDFSIVWNDNGYHKIGNVNSNLTARRVYIINNNIEDVEVVCR